jgi:hypothetical protein
MVELGGYSRVEHVERVENAELRRIRRAGILYLGAVAPSAEPRMSSLK